MKKRMILFIVVFILFQFPGFIHGAIPASERAALIALYNSTNGDNWINNSGWKTPPLHTDGFAMPGTEGSWYGVIVSSDHVRELILVGNQMSGGIPAQLDNLIYLENFEMEGSPMSDSIPDQVNKSQLKHPLMQSYKLQNDAESGNDILISGAKAVLPDLVPFQPSGWTDKVVVSNVDGTNTDNIIYANQVVYIDYSVANAGYADITGGFWVEIWDDTIGGLVRRGYWSSPLLAQYYFRFLDHLWLFSSAGWHTIRLKIDADNNVYESNESNNQYIRQIYVYPTLPTVTTDSVYSITTNSAFCGGNVLINGGVNVIARGVCWSTSSNPTISNARTTDGSGTGSFTSYISGLNPGTMYYVRAYATNSAGTDYGSNVSFTTNQISTTIPTVSTSSVYSISTNSAVCGGNVISDGGATVTARGVCWSATSNPTINNSRTIDGSGTGSFTSNITGLTASTTYYVRAYATNSNGTSYGSNVSFTTNSASTTPTVTTNSVSSITSNSAVCGGYVTSDGGSPVTARGVCWSTSSNPTIYNLKTIDGSGTGSFTSSMSGLNPSTTYYVRAYATNIKGTSYGSNVSFTTNSTSTTTPTVTTNSVSSITSSSAVCGGNVTSDGGATVTARGVCWNTSSNPTTSNARTIDGSSTGAFTSYISGLNPGTTYYVRAYATNSNGTSYGPNVSFTTNPASTPIADLYGTPTSGNTPLTVQFYDQSQPGEGASITSWYWDFGDGTTASGKNPTHTYNNPGIYDVKLTIKNSSGYEDSEIKNNYITVTNSSSTPIADFSGIPTSGSAPLTVQFYDQSIPGSGATVTSWEWEFGDGSTSFHKNPTHTYTSQGTYTVKLSVTNSFENSDTITKKNYVNTCNNCLLYRLSFPGGINMKVTNGYGKDYHINKDYYCVDFNLTGESDAGIPVLAVADGIVTYAQWNTGGYGFRVVIDHGNGITSNYSHGASINVSKDEFVKQGQELMVIWDTGKSDGFHLHFGMRENGESMPLPQFSGCTNGCSFNPIEANGYASDNVVNNPGKIIEENKADISGSFDGNESYYGHDSKYSWKYAKEGTSTTIVTYRPQFSKKVSCDIFVYIPPFNATTTAAKYKVNHVGGTETFTVNQFNVPASSIKPDNWVRLGDKTFEFGSGSDYYVQVGNGVDNYKKDQRVGFDAVYFKINESGGGSTGTPKIGLNRTTFNFGAIASGPTSDSDMLFINNTGKGTLKWTADSNAPWLNISPKSGTNSGTINFSINSTGLYAGTYNGGITIADTNASNSPRTVSVTLKVYQWGWTGSPFGDFATPTDYSTIRSSVPVTGWALDDVGIGSIKIYNGNKYIGDAVFVEGARPDVEQAYPNYPNNYKAGWGYMLLTNFLPNNGNGTFTLLAIAADMEGNQVTLGTKTILVDNVNAVKPFGAIDTPTQGGTASGSNYRNWGWVLTPQPNMIPINGSTIKVWVDGVKLGHPTYNIYRSDIASLFPGYANSNGAAGYYDIDMTAYDNGVHTIQWTAADSGGNTDGIGSRYFTIQNIGSSRSSSAAMENTFAPGYKYLIDIPIAHDEPVKFKKGYTDDYWSEDLFPNTDGITHIQCKELERIEIQVSRAGVEVEGYMMVGNRLISLPVGSTFEKMGGRFHWIPGPGFVGTYSMGFIETNKYGEKSRKHILVTIDPKFSRE